MAEEYSLLRQSLSTAKGAAALPIDFARYRLQPNRPTPVFVVGCGNSGTSIVKVILGHHSNALALSTETGFMLRERRGLDLALIRRRPLAAATKFSRLAQGEDCAIWIEKTPRHVHSIDLLLRFDPASRVIIVVRDPLDVVASFINRGYSFRRALDRWVHDNTAALPWLTTEGRSIGLRYEDLVADPERALRPACTHIGVDFEAGMLDYSATPQQIEQPNESTPPAMAAHWSRRTAQLNRPLEDRRNTWADTLDAAQAAEVRRTTEQLHADLLGALTPHGA